MKRPIDVEELDALCEAYCTTDKARQALADEQRDIKDKIVAISGNLEELETGKFSVQVKRAEAWTWDQDALAKQAESLPEEIDIHYSIDKQKFASLDPSIQKVLMGALTTKLGRTTVKISPTKR